MAMASLLERIGHMSSSMVDSGVMSKESTSLSQGRVAVQSKKTKHCQTLYALCLPVGCVAGGGQARERHSFHSLGSRLISSITVCCITVNMHRVVEWVVGSGRGVRLRVLPRTHRRHHTWALRAHVPKLPRKGVKHIQAYALCAS